MTKKMILASGSNLGNRLQHLQAAKSKLSEIFEFEVESQVYTSAAVDYTDQPDFLNQALQFSIPDIEAEEAMLKILEIEKSMGRERIISRGPRTIDIDMLFWGVDSINTPNLITPHPRWSERSFVVLPLLELPYAEQLKKTFDFPTNFAVDAAVYIA